MALPTIFLYVVYTLGPLPLHFLIPEGSSAPIDPGI